MPRINTAKLYVAATAQKFLWATDEQKELIDQIVGLALQKKFDDCLGLIDQLQHETEDGLKMTAFCFTARNEIENAKTNEGK